MKSKNIDLDLVAQDILNNKNVYGATLCIEDGENALSFNTGVGDIHTGDSYFIASVTKLYVTAILLMLQEKGILHLEDKIAKYLSEEIIEGLHILNDKDYSQTITIRHVLSNTSGIPDYYYYSERQKKVSDHPLDGEDQPWPFEKAIAHAKQIKPKFIPGQKGKVNYSDTNFRILGKIIERATSQSIDDILEQYICEPLGLKDTYIYRNTDDTKPVLMYYKTKKVSIPKYMASIESEGGVVATAKDNMIFLKAFMQGKLFDQALIETLKDWEFIWVPTLYFGIGIEKLYVPRILSLTNPIDDILGFWGQSGAFAFYHPQTDLYFTGTVNQLTGRGHSAAMNAMLKVIKQHMK